MVAGRRAEAGRWPDFRERHPWCHSRCRGNGDPCSLERFGSRLGVVAPASRGPSRCRSPVGDACTALRPDANSCATPLPDTRSLAAFGRTAPGPVRLRRSYCKRLGARAHLNRGHRQGARDEHPIVSVWHFPQRGKCPVVPGRALRLRAGDPGWCRRRLLGSGGAAAPGRESLALLPSGPDAVRTLPVRGTRPSTPRVDALPVTTALGRRSVPLERISGSGNR
jgi:hypothetical protein